MKQLVDYKLSPITGPLLENPLIELPKPFQVWNDLVERMPRLHADRKLRQAVEQLPLLDVGGLQGHGELRLAHKILTFLTSVYIWQDGEGGECLILPPQLATPLIDTSRRLGLQPILGHADLVYANCHIDAFEGAEHPRSISWTHNNLKDGLVYQSEECRNNAGINCSPQSFALLPKLIDTRDNTSCRCLKLQCCGANAAQSICIQAFDAFLQIQHNVDDQQFFANMCQYMIAEHRQFLEDLWSKSRIRHFVKLMGIESPELKQAYDACVASLCQFRRSHIDLVRRFIIEQSASHSSRIKALESTGTGGQSKKKR